MAGPLACGPAIVPLATSPRARVERRGLEPLTPCLQSRCATNCANAPWVPRNPGGSGLGDRVRGLLPGAQLGVALVELTLREDGAGCGDDDQHELLHQAISL